MQTITKVNKFKDAHPFNTIQRIRDILWSVGLTVHEEFWNDVSSKCFSVRVELDDFPGVGMNGKGTSRLFALASAYGELIERLQNKKLLRKIYGLTERDKNFADEYIGDLTQFSKEHPRILKSLVKDYSSPCFQKMIKDYPKLGMLTGFRNAFTDEIDCLPSSLINMACGTNGMCAGNTNFEAICHGVCEILERYVIRQIVLDELELPEIPYENIVEPESIALINLFRQMGLKVSVKDCSMGGKFPVVGVLITNKNETAYQFRLGSESVFSIALERCLTELLQASNADTIHSSLLPIRQKASYSYEEKIQNIKNIAKNGSGQYPPSIFIKNQFSTIPQHAFLTDIPNNEFSYNHLLSLLKENSFTLYVKDLSYLGFPTYKLYIPEMAEVFLLDTDTILQKIKVQQMSKYLLNIWDLSPEEHGSLADALAKHCYDYGTFLLADCAYYKGMNLHVASPNPLATVDLRLFASLLYVIGKQYQEAAEMFSWFMSTLESDNYANIDYYRCIASYLILKAGGPISTDDIRSSLSSKYGSEIADEVIEDFKNETTALLAHMSLPTCPDCGKCKIANYCKRDIWSEKNKVLNEKMMASYQASL